MTTFEEIKHNCRLLEKCLSQHQNQSNRIGKGKKRNIFIRDKNRCLRCDSKENLTIDHIVPISLGGIGIKLNLQTLCDKCNKWKGEMIIDFTWQRDYK